MEWDLDDLDEMARREDAGRDEREAQRAHRGEQLAAQVRSAQEASRRRAAVAARTGRSWAQQASGAAPMVRHRPAAAPRAARPPRAPAAAPARSLSLPNPLSHVVSASRSAGRAATGASGDTAVSRLVGATFFGGLALVAVAFVTGRDFNITLPPGRRIADTGPSVGSPPPGSSSSAPAVTPTQAAAQVVLQQAAPGGALNPAPTIPSSVQQSLAQQQAQLEAQNPLNAYNPVVAQEEIQTAMAAHRVMTDLLSLGGAF